MAKQTVMLPDELQQHPDRQMSGPQVGAFLEISETKLRQLVKDGVLTPVFRSANAQRFRFGDVLRVARGAAMPDHGDVKEVVGPPQTRTPTDTRASGPFPVHSVPSTDTAERAAGARRLSRSTRARRPAPTGRVSL